MATQKVTEKELAQNVKDEASVLITQQEMVNDIPTEALKRATLASIVEALRKNGINKGYQTEKGLQDMHPYIVKQIEAIDTGLRVYFYDDNYADIPVGATGLAFDEVVYDSSGYLHIFNQGEDVVPACYIGGVGGGGYGSVLKLINKLSLKTFTSMKSDEQVLVKYLVTSFDSETQEPTGEISEEWHVNGTRVSVRTVHQGENEYDVKPFLTDTQTNTVKLTVEDAYGNTRSLTWNISLTEYGVTWNLEKMAIHGTDSINVRLVSTGTGTKTVKLLLDGEEILSKIVTVDNGTTQYSLPPQTHGVHTLVAYLETTIEGETLKTTELRHVGIWEEEGRTEPSICFYDDELTVKQFDTASILWMAATPGIETTSVQLKKGEETVAELNVDRGIQTWAHKSTAVGTEELSVVGMNTSDTLTLNVESIGYDISPVTDGVVLDINPEGHSNTETTKTEFGYTDAEGTNHPFTFSDNFDWTNGGFQLDEKGVTAFVVKRGCYVTADRSLFDTDAKTDGKQIKMIFKPVMARTADTEIISCMSGGIGISVKPEETVLSSELKSMSIPYCTDKKIEMDVSIEAESDSKFACVYLKAQPSRGMEYVSGDRWSQSTPAMLKIGSDEADIWIYRIKMYSYALTRREMLQNYIADCADTAEMVARFERNDVYNSDGSLDMHALAEKNQKLRVFHIKGNKMTTAKDDEVVVDVEMIFTEGGEEHHFIATGVTMKAQGTSSLEYVAAALNLDMDFSTATSWVNGNGEAVASYAFGENAIPVNYINLKADVASCEKANNVLNVERYNRFNPFVFKGKAEDSRVRDTVEGHPCAVFFTNTSDTSIEVGDRTLAAGATMLYFSGNMNNSKKNFKVFGQDNSVYPEQCCVEVMNNNAAECRYKANIGDNETWDDLTDADKEAGKVNNFQFRFPKNPTDAMKTRFKELHSWIVSTDTTAATNEPLEQSVTYGEVDGLGNTISYTTDSAEYRKAKFKHEVVNYFHTRSLDFHYLYTEFTCGCDNRAKNTFISYEPDVNGVWKWSFRTHYDHDTSWGNDNSGGLTFTYGLEDVDMVGNAYVFNAADSVLWCNVRDLRKNELANEYISRASLNCWDSDDILNEFNAYQLIRPEALELEDAYNKYRVTSAARFRSMMLGTKEYQRELFVRKQSVYMASKYRSGLCTENKITLRTNVTEGSTAKGDINGVVPSVDMYLRCQFGNLGEYVVRAKAGETYTMTCPDGSVLNDLETYIFCSKWISEIGSLAHLRPKFVDISNAPLLRKIEIGSADAGLVNTTMNTENTGGITFDNNPYIEYIDLRNIPYLSQPIDLSKLTSLEEIYTTNSGITGVTFAKGSPLRIAALNNLKRLVALGLDKIESFTVGSSMMTSIWVEGSPAIDTLAIVKNATVLERGRLPDVHWNDENADAVTSLMRKAGFDEFGKDVPLFVLKGSAHLSMVAQEEIDAIRDKFDELTVTYEQILESFTVTFQNYDGTVFPEATQVVRKFGSAVNPVTAGLISAPAREPTVDTEYTFIGWDASFNYVLSNLVVTAVYSEKTRTYSVKWWLDEAETSLLDSVTGVEARSGVEYSGVTPSVSSGAIWMGWDTPTNSVTSDLNVHAVFVTPTLPDSVAVNYDYLYSDNPDDNSGYSLAEFYGIITSGVAKNYFAVGDKIKIVATTTAFVDSEIVLQVYDFNHYKLSDGTEFAPVVFGMVGLMNANYQMNSTITNVGGWDVSKMRKYLNETVFPALPIQWRAMIKEVDVLASEGNTSATITTSADKLFLFSQAEVGFNVDAVPYSKEVDAEAENLTFPIFTDNASRIKKTYNGEGTAVVWWLRSPVASWSGHFCFVNGGGGSGSSFSNDHYANRTMGVAFGFCI